MTQLYRVDVLNELRDEWLPGRVFTDKSSADALACRLNRPILIARVVAFTPRPVVTKKGTVVVLDELGRMVFDSTDKFGPLYRNRNGIQEAPITGGRITDRLFDDVESRPDVFEPTEGSVLASEELLVTGNLQDEESTTSKPPEPVDPMDLALEAFHRKLQGKDR
jgi:hypothetical protein